MLNRLLIHDYMRIYTQLLRDVSKLFSYLDAKLSAIHFRPESWDGEKRKVVLCLANNFELIGSKVRSSAASSFQK